MFHGKERDHGEVWFLIRIYIFFWTSILNNFCNYSIGNIYSVGPLCFSQEFWLTSFYFYFFVCASSLSFFT